MTTAFEDRASEFRRTLTEVARHSDGDPSLPLLDQGDSRLIHSGWDNWDGGTEIYTFELSIAPKLFATVEEHLDRLEVLICGRLQRLLRSETGLMVSQVAIVPQSGPTQPTPSAGLDRIWEPDLFRLFLSHSSSVKRKVEALRGALLDAGITGFVAHVDIEPTREWQTEIERALATMDALAAILTPDFRGSKWCDQEVGAGIGAGKLVVPLRAGADPHGFLGRHQGLQIRGLRSSEVVERIFVILAKHERSGRALAEVTVQRFLASPSWESARARLGWIEKLPELDTDLQARLAQESMQNEKIAESHGVPARLERLSTAHGATRS